MTEVEAIGATGEVGAVAVISALPAHAVMNDALMMLQGKKVGVGTDLGVPGYTNLKKCYGLDGSAHCYQGNAILKLTKSNMGKYNF